MKTFLNVLYRRILYKIPLKFLLVLLVISAILIASFSNASDVSSLTTYINSASTSIPVGGFITLVDTNNNTSNYGTYCIHIKSMSTNNNQVGWFSLGFNQTLQNNTDTAMNLYTDWGDVYACIYTNMRYVFLNNIGYYTIYIDYDLFKLNVLMNTELPVLTSLECQTEYNLIPISSVDSNYCTTNNLCPSSGPSDCPNVGVSNVFINDIFHPGSFNIIMNIPEEIDWDYAYTNSGNNLNIDVVGYNVDYEKIDSIVQFQNYKPTSEDFQKIIGLLAPYTKIIVFFVFLFIVWAWIKKPFKSKKL